MSASNSVKNPVNSRRFSPVFDSGRRRIKGLSLRNGKFYGAVWTMTASGKKSCRRVILRNQNGSLANCIKQARDSYARLRVNASQVPKICAERIPTLTDFSSLYLLSSTTCSKGKRTVERESQCLGLWEALYGTKKLNEINTSTIREFIEARLRGININNKYYPPVSLRTSVIDIISLRNLLKFAIDAGHINELPRFPNIKVPPPPRKELLSDSDFQRLIAACGSNKPSGEPISKNGSQLADLLVLLDLSGIRETEAYAIGWQHVDLVNMKLWIGVGLDFNASTVSIGSGGNCKNRKSRAINMSNNLKTHLLEMKERRSQNSRWLFPSPKGKLTDRNITSLRESLNLIKNYIGLKKFGFHDCRHRFASRCVMSGIDYMTIAKWLGHQDGGILVGRVYGHLSDEHQKKMARRLSN
jgi:integrase